MPNETYNVQNEVTGTCILTEQGVPVEYDPPVEDVQIIADNFTANTGQNHVVLGPHPKPRPNA